MRFLRTLLLLVATLGLPVPATAVTVRDIIELTKAGLPDDVLVAVIDADRTIFALDKEQILQLKEAGVSKAVLLKMLRSRREFEPAQKPLYETVAPPPSPEVVVIGAQPSPPPVTVVVPQYFYVPYSIWGVPTHHVPRTPPQPFMSPEFRGFGRFINDGWVDTRRSAVGGRRQ